MAVSGRIARRALGLLLHSQAVCVNSLEAASSRCGLLSMDCA